MNYINSGKHLPQNILKLSYFEITEGYPGKSRTFSHRVSVSYHPYHIESIKIIIGVQKCIQHEELTNYICKIKHFYKQVKSCKICSFSLVAIQTTQVGKLPLEFYEFIVFILSLYLNPLFQIYCKILNEFLSVFSLSALCFICHCSYFPKSYS